MNEFMAGWHTPREMLAIEATQLKEEGREPAWVDKLMNSLDLTRASTAELSDLWTRLQAAPMRTDFAFAEPSDLEGIRAARDGKSRTWRIVLGDDVLFDRMHGAWLGRCCGCALGKPVETFMDARNGLTSRERIRTYLEAAGAYPLDNYIPGQSPAQERTGALVCPASQRENIAFMETDDDIRYTVLGQKVLRQHGASFDTVHVMRAWLGELPYSSVCTAETQAYRNYVLRYQFLHSRLVSPPDVDWTWVATHQNPYREWIGAQIRADSWGYAAPGNPGLAAEFAWRDARMSHVKNGIYGEMLVAAMIAAGFALNDPLAVIEAGLAEIPSRSRLYAEMRQVIDICARHEHSFAHFEKVLDEIEALLGHYHPVHTNNNAALVVAALLLGGSDFEKVITLAVMGGWDTDCNGATAGSIFGAMHGTGAIPEKWRGPLNDTLYSQVSDYHPIAITECARRSAALARTIVAG
jgi:ADP-ribosylglycohydrolase